VVWWWKRVVAGTGWRRRVQEMDVTLWIPSDRASHSMVWGWGIVDWMGPFERSVYGKPLSSDKLYYVTCLILLSIIRFHMTHCTGVVLGVQHHYSIV
jgi:hypothetical protein